MNVCTAGIVLKTLRYSDTQEIHTIYTEQFGLLSLLTKISKKEQTPPLFEGEFTLRKGKSFFHLIDARQTFYHGPVRERLDWIETALRLFHYILKSQLSLKASPALYHLLRTFLGQIPKAKNPLLLQSVFVAKLLLHEGHLDLDHPLLPLLAAVRSFKELDTLEIVPEELSTIHSHFLEIYENIPTP